MSHTQWSLYQMFLKGEGTDCAFFVQINNENSNSSKIKTIFAHRLILSAASPVFKHIIEGGACVNIKIDKVDETIFKKLLRYYQKNK